MNTKEMLIAAKKLIDTPEKFTTLSLAKDFNGNTVLIFSPEAVCFCSAGAVYKVANVRYYDISGNSNIKSCFDYLRAAIPDSNINDIAIYSDSQPHAEVMKWWDRAICLAEDD